MLNRRGNLKALALASALVAGSLSFSVQAQTSNTIKVGILHSLSGTMAISETVLKDTVLMAIDEINAKGGVLGKKLEPVVVDPASNWPLFAEKTKQLLGQDKVSVIFGCWTSVSRKSVLPVVEEMNGLAAKPKLLILDEPTEGIQPSIIKDIGRVIRRLADEGMKGQRMAVLLCEQYYDFAEELADAYMVMERGEVIAKGPGKEMQAKSIRQLVAI
jgi:hypothetical protein